MATGTNAIAIFNDLTKGAASGYKYNNKTKAVINQELRDHTMYKYDSANLTKCVKYDSITRPTLTNLERGQNLASCNVAFKGGQIIYRIPAKDLGSFKGTLSKSTTPEQAVTTVENYRSDATIYVTDTYTYTVNNSEIQGTFKIYLAKDGQYPDKIYISVWRDSAITYNASGYTHDLYKNEASYLNVYIRTTSINGETCSYNIPLSFVIQIYQVMSS